MPFRPHGEFIGTGANKQLSAHTIATFMYLQGAKNFDDLKTEVPMNAITLKRLLRGRAVEWWTNARNERPGEPAWLALDGTTIRLTPDGLSKVIQRAHGEDRTASDRRSPYNVSLNDIRLALDLIYNGSRSTLGAVAPLEFIE